MAGLRMAAPLQVLRAGGSEALVGPLLSVLALGSVAMALPAGKLADRHGYHAPVHLAVALTVIGAALAVLATYAGAFDYAVMCVGMLVSGAGGNAGLIAIQRSAGRSARDVTELKRVFSWMGMAPSFSNVVGPMLAGVLIDAFGFREAFAALALIPLLSLLCARFVPREPARVADATEVKPAAWDLLREPLLRKLFLVNWFMSASWDVHSFVVPVLGHERGLSASAIGTILGAFAASVTSVRFLIPLLAHRLSERHVLLGAMNIVALGLFVYPWTRGALSMTACAVVLGLALGASQPMVMTALHRITPAARHGQAIALRSMVLNSSSALMPLGFAGAGAALGASGLFWLMSALVASGTFVARSLASDPTQGALHES
jgi:MFS family permease